MRAVFLVLLMSMAGTAAAQSLWGKVESSPGVTRLTWEQMTQDSPPYPFSERLETCLQTKIDAYHTTTPCLLIPHEYLPTKLRPGSRNKRMQNTYFDKFHYLMGYWDDRLNSAYVRLMEHYRDIDTEYAKKFSSYERMRNVQRRWLSWRETKCEFERYKTRIMGRWMKVFAELDCRYVLTAERALELEAILRFNGLDIVVEENSRSEAPEQ